MLRVPGHHDVLAGEHAGEPAGELRRRDPVCSKRRGAGRLGAGGAFEVVTQESVTGGDVVVQEFQQAFAAQPALQ